MRPFLFLVTVSVFASSVAGAAEPPRFASGLARVALIELFTSEGCSSCPPAEKWLGTLRDDTGLWKTFVPVAWHVNYWDKLGWPDRFATREGTQREYTYAEAWRSESVYTPCFVRDGAEWRVRGGTVEATSDGTPVGVLSASYDGAVVRAEFVPAIPIGGRRSVGAGKENGGDGAPSEIHRGRVDDLEIHAALLGGGIVSKVTRGENRGETLQHEFVVLAQAHGMPGADIALPKREVAGVTRYALALWVTRRGEQAPLQATGGWVD